MRNNTVKLNHKNQIVIPEEARGRLGLRAGDEMVVRIRGDRIELVPRPRSYTKAVLGLGSDLWRGIDVAAYVSGEREAWHMKQSA